MAAYAGSQGAGWFTGGLDTLPQTTTAPELTFEIGPQAVTNRRDGIISPQLVSSYVFLQFGEIGPANLAKHADTLDALFIRSASIGFVDYLGDRVLDWDRASARIPMDVKGMIRQANELGIPVFLELNYTDYVPGPLGTGTDSLKRADNTERTVSFLEALEAAGLRIAGFTFGDEIDDESGYGALKPTLSNDDVLGRFVTLATALKEHDARLKIYAFDSYIAATRGLVSQSLDLLRKVRAAELVAGRSLIDGFVFRESYVYMNDKGAVLGSQDILDDTESLAGSAPVKRYDVNGTSGLRTDRGYLVTLVQQTQAIFGRVIDIGITEYLPAGPVQINESDTSKYADIDFLIHYADVVGTYAEQGLDIVSTWMFANTVDDSKCYVSKTGVKALSYPVHEQLAQEFKGSQLEVKRSDSYDSVKVKLYAARHEQKTFIMVLNKDVASGHTVRLVLPGEYDVLLTLPARGYTSLLLDGAGITISGVAG